MPKPAKDYKCHLTKIAAYCTMFSRYFDKKKGEIILFLFIKIVVYIVVGISKSFASFATLVPLSLFERLMQLRSYWVRKDLCDGHHIAEFILQTINKTCNCRHKRTKYSARPTTALLQAKLRCSRSR